MHGECTYPGSNTSIHYKQINSRSPNSLKAVSEVTADGAALDAAVAWAERIAENAPLAVSASKKLVRAAGMGIDEDSLWEMQTPLMQKVFSSNDAKEGPAAFAEKRAPNWSGT